MSAGRPPLRVLHCTSGNLHGGIETFLATLGRNRSAAPGMAAEFALGFEGRLASELRDEGAAVHVLGPASFRKPWTVWGARRGLRRLLRSRPFDVVVCHSCWPHALFGPVARLEGLPLVFWLHDRVGGDHWLDRAAARLPPDSVVVNSLSSAETLPRLFPASPSEIIPYPVEPPGSLAGDARAEVRAELGTAPETVAILQTSRLEPWKGHALLIAALGRLRDRPGWEAWIAGGVQRPHEQAYLDGLRAQAAAAGVGDRVRFLGQRSDVPRLLAAADVHCQPNTGPEPFGIAFVEALYAGLPAVSTRMGGAAEIIDETCGVLVPADDPPALASALAALIADPEARRRLGAGGPARARRLCDPAAALARIEAFCRAVVA